MEGTVDGKEDTQEKEENHVIDIEENEEIKRNNHYMNLTDECLLLFSDSEKNKYTYDDLVIDIE